MVKTMPFGVHHDEPCSTKANVNVNGKLLLLTAELFPWVPAVAGSLRSRLQQ
jgi:hypothetical protein